MKRLLPASLVTLAAPLQMPAWFRVLPASRGVSLMPVPVMPSGAHVGFAQFSAPAATTNSSGQFHLPLQRQFSPLPMFTLEFVHVTLQISHPHFSTFTKEIDRSVEDDHLDVRLQRN